GYMAALGTERHHDRDGEKIDALHHSSAGIRAKTYSLCGHVNLPAFLLFDHAKNVGLLENQMFLTVDFDIAAGVLAKQNPVALRDAHRDHPPVVIAPAGSGRHDLPFLRFLLGGVGNDDSTPARLFSRDPLDDHAIVQRTHFDGYGRFSARDQLSNLRYTF